jgi:lactate dehydrogenase-like 2-hydroxyacid dehydrogenase
MYLNKLSMRVYILNPIKEVMTKSFIKELRSLENIHIDMIPKNILSVKGILDATEDKIISLDPDFCDWTLTNETIKSIPRLKAILLTSTSFSFIDTEFCKDNGIIVANLKGFSTKAVAGWAIMMMLNLYRKVPLLIRNNFVMSSYSTYTGLDFSSKTIGIIGLGEIGTQVASYAQGLGMNVIYWSRTSRDNRFKYSNLNKLFKTADVIYPTLAITNSSKKLITDAMLKSMKKNCIVISNAKEAYNHELVLELVKKNHIYGYGFEGDDFNKYKGNVWTSPSLAWCTEETFKKNGELLLENLKLALKGKYPNQVNK